MSQLIKESFKVREDLASMLKTKFEHDYFMLGEKNNNPSTMETKESFCAKKYAEVVALLESYKQQVLDGLELYKSEETESASSLSPLLNKVENFSQFTEEDIRNKTARELLNVEELELINLYDLASDAINSRDSDAASKMFAFFTWMNPKNYLGWLGYGLAQSLAGNYANAILFYEVSGLIDPSKPYPYLYAADSYYRLGDKQNALHNIDQALQLAEAGGEFYAESIPQAEALKAKIKSAER